MNFQNVTIRSKEIAQIEGISQKTAKKELTLMLAAFGYNRNFLYVWEYCLRRDIDLKTLYETLQFFDEKRKNKLKAA